MNAIELMMSEHENIKRMLGVVRKYSYKVLKNEDVDIDDFYKMIDFIRNYADKHHHSKEEEILFKKMIKELPHTESPILGMYSEHDLGRLYIGNLEESLKKVKDGDLDSKVDIIGSAMAYADLLSRHIHKEDSAIYKFAEKQLSENALKEIEESCREVEDRGFENKIQDKYLKIIETLEKMI